MTLATYVLLSQAESFICTMCRLDNLDDTLLMRVVAGATEYLIVFWVQWHTYASFLAHRFDGLFDALWRYHQVIGAFFAFATKRKIK